MIIIIIIKLCSILDDVSLPTAMQVQSVQNAPLEKNNSVVSKLQDVLYQMRCHKIVQKGCYKV